MFEHEYLNWFSHKVQVTNGKGLLKIRMSKHMDYLEYKSPVTFHWEDSGPATFLCDYLTSLPLSWRLKEEINESMNKEIDRVSKDMHTSAFERVEPLLDVFENGKYGIYYSDQFEESKLVFPPKIKNRNDKIKFLSEWHKASDNPACNEDTLLIEPYGNYWPIVATQHEINQERVVFYINQIKEGKRPAAILYCSFYEHNIINKDGSLTDDSVYSNFYVIDGHHKLVAYEKEGISPPIIFIAHLPDKLADVVPICNEVFKNVQPFHFAAMMRSVKPADSIALQIMNGENEILKEYLKKFSYYFAIKSKNET